MKKRILAATLFLAMALALCASAAPAPHYDDAFFCKPYLSFDGRTAACSIGVEADTGAAIKASLTLYHIVDGKEVFAKSWPNLKGTTSLDFTGYYYVAVPGDQYKLTATATVGRDEVTNSVTATCR